MRTLSDLKKQIARQVAGVSFDKPKSKTEHYMENKDARKVIDTFLPHINPFIRTVTIAGSIRRNVAMVGDAELVVEPSDLSAYLARLDTLYLTGVVSRAVYPDGAHRWGDKYRGIVFDSLRIELFTCDIHNRGYIQWLRTGPADANKHVMASHLYHPLVRFKDGYAWTMDKRLSIPTEDILFRLLRIPYVMPSKRTREEYDYQFHHHRQPNIDLTRLYAPPTTPTQPNMFSGGG